MNDIREINRHIKENLDEETLNLMLEKADRNKDGRVTFEDFYSVMIKNNFWFTILIKHLKHATLRIYQYLISKLRHFISEWTRKHLRAQILSPHRGQLERDKLPQIEQYFLEG